MNESVNEWRILSRAVPPVSTSSSVSSFLRRGQGDAIVDCPPTFTMYAFDAAVNDARVIRVPRRPDFSIDVPAVRAAVAAHSPKMLFLTSPNNPDGSELAEADLVALLELPVLVVLDEAYIEFSSLPSHIGWVPARDNLVVLRTFSKRAGLAGLRVGYGAFPSAMIDFLWRAKQPYNVSVAAEVAAVAALGNPGYLADVRDKLIAEARRGCRVSVGVVCGSGWKWVGGRGEGTEREWWAPALVPTFIPSSLPLPSFRSLPRPSIPPRGPAAAPLHRGSACRGSSRPSPSSGPTLPRPTSSSAPSWGGTPARSRRRSRRRGS